MFAHFAHTESGTYSDSFTIVAFLASAARSFLQRVRIARNAKRCTS